MSSFLRWDPIRVVRSRRRVRREDFRPGETPLTLALGVAALLCGVSILITVIRQTYEGLPGLPPFTTSEVEPALGWFFYDATVALGASFHHYRVGWVVGLALLGFVLAAYAIAYGIQHARGVSPSSVCGAILCLVGLVVHLAAVFVAFYLVLNSDQFGELINLREQQAGQPR